MTSDPRQPRDIPAGDISRPGVRRSRPLAIPRRDRPLDSLRQISWRLESRDYVLAHLLTEHRVLTTAQISSVLFTSPRTCRNRLDVLRKLNFIDWFIPVRHGRRLATHWVPGPLSARYVALAHGERPPTPKSVRQHQDTMVSTSHLAHTDGTNQFFIDLLSHTRQHPDTRLTRWWSAARTANALGRRVQPDGHGAWSDATGNVAFLLEYDTGTEFSGGRCRRRTPDRCVCAAQELVVERYLVQRVW